MAGDGRYWAFISYANEDAAHAQWLHAQLERVRIPPDLADRASAGPNTERIAPVFLDRAELGSSPDLTLALQAALDRAAFLVVICSVNAARSERVNAEVDYFVRVRGKARVLCLLTGGRPNAVARGLPADQECLPDALRPGVVDAAEPLAADIRSGKATRRLAVQHLVAGMLGVGLDAIRRRELQRRQRALLWAVTGVSSVLAVTAILAVYAWTARSDAIHNAQLAHREAESARQLSDFLISIFSTSDPSESRGNTITARELLDRAAARIASDATGGNDTRGRLMESIGTVYRQLGLHVPARPMLENALALAGPDPTAQRADALYGLALLDSRSDRDTQAEAGYRESLRILAPCEMNAAACSRRYSALAHLLVKQGRTADALIALDAASRLATTLGDSVEAAQALDTYSYLHREQADFAQAEPFSLRALDMRKRLFGDTHPDVAKSLYGLALLNQEARRRDRALGYAQQALAVDRKLYGEEHPEALTTIQMIGILHAEAGEFASAKPYFEKTLRIRERVLGPEHTETGYAVYNLGCLYADMKEYDAALKHLERAQAVWEKSEGPEHADVAYALDQRALVLVRLRRAAVAEPLAQRALSINLKAYRHDHPNIARSRLNLARVLVAQGKRDAARAQYQDAIRTLVAAYQEGSDVVKGARLEFAALER